MTVVCVSWFVVGESVEGERRRAVDVCQQCCQRSGPTRWLLIATLRHSVRPSVRHWLVSWQWLAAVTSHLHRLFVIADMSYSRLSVQCWQCVHLLAHLPTEIYHCCTECRHALSLKFLGLLLRFSVTPRPPYLTRSSQSCRMWYFLGTRL